MRRPVPSKAEDRPRIAMEGSKAARRKFRASRQAIENAMERIERAVEANGGEYPSGRVSIAEVLREAGKSEAYLRKTDQPSVIELRQRVQDFVDRANTLIERGASTIRQIETDRVRDAQAELKRTQQAYAEAEVEYADARKQLEIAEKTIEEMRSELTMLRAKLSDEKVINLKSMCS
ncbi:chromosome segregation ATPase [Bradyrhizobium sp. F1.13.1]